MDSATASTERHELTDSTGVVYSIAILRNFTLCVVYLPIAATPTSILDKKPSLKDACNLLRDHLAEWDDIGLQLDVPFDVREEWHKDGSLTNKQRLQRVINRWLVSECNSAVTWIGLINILKQSDYTATAKKIESFLKTEYAQEHYKSL